MERNRERSSCCGAGAGVKSAFPEDARQIAENRITDAEKTGADILVSSCSFCILNLKSACENEKKGKIKCLEVKDISEILKRGIEI
jgi:Fe-S oxidoreductase